MTKPTYSRAEVLDLLDIVSEEAEAAIQESFNEGYKAGAVDFAPRVAALETINEELKKQLEIKTKYANALPYVAFGGFALGSIINGLVFTYAGGAK